MKKIICKNSYGNMVTFTESFPYFLENYEGIHEKISELSSVSSAFSIGELYQGRKIPKRNIILYGYFKEHFFERKQFLYNLFSDNDEGILYYYEDKHSVKINYRVEKVHIDEIGAIRYFTISLMCHNPLFLDIEESKVSLSNWEGGLEFPLEIKDDQIEFEKRNNVSLVEIDNPTKLESGLRIIFFADGVVKNPTLKNIITQEEITLDFEMQLGDVITITTYINNKNIILKRNGIETNINNTLLFGTKYLQLKPGTNNLKVSASEGANKLTAEVYYSIYYEAV